MNKVKSTFYSRSLSYAEWGYLGILSLIWGCSFFFGEIILEELPPFTLVLGRVFIAALFLNLTLGILGIKLPTSINILRDFFIMGLLNNLIPFSLIFWGQTMITSSLAAIINASTPLWSIILAHFFTSDEKITKNRLLGIIIAICGVIVMIGIDALNGANANVFGEILVLCAGISYSLGGIYSKKLREIPPIVTATGQLTSCALIMIPITFIFDKPHLLPHPSLNAIASLCALAILGTAIAYIIFFKLLSTAGATNSLLVTILVPVVAIILGTFVLDETLTKTHIIGMMLITMGLLIIDGRVLKKLS